jgi:hypothetical protein
MKSALVLVLALFAVHPAVPQPLQDGNGPSMQDTAQWIVNNLNRAGGTYTDPKGGSETTEQNIRSNISACVLTYTSDFTSLYKPCCGLRGATSHFTSSLTIPLGSLTSIREVIDNGYWYSNGTPYLFLTSQTNTWTQTISNAISDSDTWGPKDGTYSLGQSRFVFNVQGQDNTDLLPRMVKALTHARDLCKASYNPHPGEPF